MELMRTFTKMVESANETLDAVEATTHVRENMLNRFNAGNVELVETLLTTLTNAATTCALFETDIDGAVAKVADKVKEIGVDSILAFQLSRLSETPDKLKKFTELLKRVTDAN